MRGTFSWCWNEASIISEPQKWFDSFSLHPVTMTAVNMQTDKYGGLSISIWRERRWSVHKERREKCSFALIVCAVISESYRRITLVSLHNSNCAAIMRRHNGGPASTLVKRRERKHYFPPKPPSLLWLAQTSEVHPLRSGGSCFHLMRNKRPGYFLLLHRNKHPSEQAVWSLIQSWKFDLLKRGEKSASVHWDYFKLFLVPNQLENKCHFLDFGTVVFLIILIFKKKIRLWGLNKRRKWQIKVFLLATCKIPSRHFLLKDDHTLASNMEVDCNKTYSLCKISTE